ncbi:52 kDa repressor of the inhibitor of the protein kinase-like [Hydra vulgaris]|uniref:52 kDa repressor of the inhibitor of the protein kinase-like n=1 Tax=Hydra vulgaris TaxID=6087 RepID=A0ABM4BPQ6_HYDVU
MTGLIDYWAKVGSSNLQNCNEELFIQKPDKQFDVKFTRKCKKPLFERKTTNGEIINRSWLCFSPFNGSIFCFVCKLMSKTCSQFTHDGFCDWKHADNRIISHETSKDSKRLVSIITFICKRGLALRGKNEIVGSSKNDSTPDEGHIDQLTLVFRYIEKDTQVERFLVFMPNQGHKAQDMYDGLINILNKYDLNIKNCRDQSYDNASAMSAKYNGLRSKILKNNKLASWIPCATHSLNLVGKAAAECCTAAVEIFDFLEQLYVFFTASTKRYELLVKALSLENSKTRIHVPQRVNTTRWSCKSDATKALILGYKQFKSTLTQIADDFEQTTKTRCDANCLYNKLCTLETGIYTVFWSNILESVDKTNKLLQDATLDPNTAISAVKSLKNFDQTKRDNFDQYEKQGVEISDEMETTDYLKHRKLQRNIRLNPIDFYETPELLISLYK